MNTLLLLGTTTTTTTTKSRLEARSRSLRAWIQPFLEKLALSWTDCQFEPSLYLQCTLWATTTSKPQLHVSSELRSWCELTSSSFRLEETKGVHTVLTQYRLYLSRVNYMNIAKFGCLHWSRYCLLFVLFSFLLHPGQLFLQIFYLTVWGTTTWRGYRVRNVFAPLTKSKWTGWLRCVIIRWRRIDEPILQRKKKHVYFQED